jgi:hypothetical protein
LGHVYLLGDRAANFNPVAVNAVQGMRFTAGIKPSVLRQIHPALPDISIEFEAEKVID